MTPALVALLLSLLGVSDDPIRACYAVNNGQPWSCYLLPDALMGEVPVYVGTESSIVTAQVIEPVSVVPMPKAAERHDDDDDSDDDDDNDSSDRMQRCTVEDGSSGPLPCYWDAKNSGNGEGESFVLNERREIIYSHEEGGDLPRRETPIDIPADEVGYHEPEATPPPVTEPEPEVEAEPEPEPEATEDSVPEAVEE